MAAARGRSATHRAAPAAEENSRPANSWKPSRVELDIPGPETTRRGHAAEFVRRHSHSDQRARGCFRPDGACRQRRAQAIVHSRGAGEDRGQRRGERFHPGVRCRRIVQCAGAPLGAHPAGGREQNRVRHVGRHGGGAVSAHDRVCAQPQPRGRARQRGRGAPERRHRPYPRLPARGDRPGRPDRRDDEARSKRRCATPGSTP